MCQHGRRHTDCADCYRDAFHARSRQFVAAWKLLRALRLLEVRPLGAAPLEAERDGQVVPLHEFQIWRSA